MAEDQEPAAQGSIHIHLVSIQPVCEFNPDAEVGASLATCWNTWIDDFEMFLTASGKTDKKQMVPYFCTKPVQEFVKFFDS